MKKTFREWVNYPSIEQQRKKLKLCWDMSNYYDNLRDYEVAKIRKEREIREQYNRIIYDTN